MQVKSFLFDHKSGRWRVLLNPTLFKILYIISQNLICPSNNTDRITFRLKEFWKCIICTLSRCFKSLNKQKFHEKWTNVSKSFNVTFLMIKIYCLKLNLSKISCDDFSNLSSWNINCQCKIIDALQTFFSNFVWSV